MCLLVLDIKPLVHNILPMKKLYLLLVFGVFFTSLHTAKGQTGYLLLNEYLPWTTNTCTVNGEFIELYNFGPGPVNIGCYILTEGDFSITSVGLTVLRYLLLIFSGT